MWDFDCVCVCLQVPSYIMIAVYKPTAEATEMEMCIQICSSYASGQFSLYWWTLSSVRYHEMKEKSPFHPLICDVTPMHTEVHRDRIREHAVDECDSGATGSDDLSHRVLL